MKKNRIESTLRTTDDTYAIQTSADEGLDEQVNLPIFFQLVKEGDLASLKSIHFPKRLFGFHDKYGKTILDYAHDKDVREYLLNYKIYNLTPLHVAALENDEKNVELLLRQHAKTNVVANLEKNTFHTPLFYAIQNNNLSIQALLRQSGASLNEALYEAAEKGSTQHILQLLDMGADPKYKGFYGTAFYQAARSGNVRNMHILLPLNKALLEIRGIYNTTPLHAAARSGNPLAVDFLIKMNANINAQTRDEETPLLYAVQYARYAEENLQDQYLKLIELLLKAGADPNIRNKKGVSPLYLAVKTNQPELVELLLAYGANVNVGTQDRTRTKTPLHAAIKYKHQAIIDVLLKNNADVNAKSVGDTPLLMALRNNDLQLFNQLFVKGANPTRFDDPWNRPLVFFAEDNLKPAVELFCYSYRLNHPSRARLALHHFLGSTTHHQEKIVVEAMKKYCLGKATLESLTGYEKIIQKNDTLKGIYNHFVITATSLALPKESQQKTPLKPNK